MTAFLELCNLRCRFGKHVAVEEFSLCLGKGELFVLLGPSGCGKSTTLRMVAGLETPTSGEISLNGKSLSRLPPPSRNVAMVFQDHTLYPHMNIEHNLGFSLKMQGLGKGEIKQRVQDVAHVLGIERRLKFKPNQLSGGEAQRVALGKALIRRPDLLLLDEPLSNLDPLLRRKLREEIRRLQQNYAITTIYVTHDQEEAMALGGHMGIMNEGRLLETGSPGEIYENPKTLFSARFLGSPQVNLIPGVLLPEGKSLNWPLATEPVLLSSPFPVLRKEAAGESVWAAIRPEHILVSTQQKSLSDIEGRVEFIQNMGFEHRLTVICRNHPLRIRCSRMSGNICEGMNVYLKIRTEKLLLFQKDTGARL